MITLFISLLWEIVALLKDLLEDLKLIIKADIIIGCILDALAGIIGKLLIVCFSWFFFLCFCSMVYDFVAYHRRCFACFHHPRFR